MSQIVCQICLRSDFVKSGIIDKKLTSFYGELCAIGINQNAVRFCIICEHRLKKFYDFRQQCRRAHSLLTNCSQKKKQSSPYLGFVTHGAQKKVFHYYYRDPRTMIEADGEILYKNKLDTIPSLEVSFHHDHDHAYEAEIVEETPSTQEAIIIGNDSNLDEKLVIQHTDSQEYNDSDMSDADISHLNDSSDAFMELEVLDSDFEEDKLVPLIKNKANQKRGTKRKLNKENDVSYQQDGTSDESDQETPKSNKQTAEVDWVEIDPYKGDSRWFSRDGHFYVVCRVRGATLSLRCASERCAARWLLKRGVPGALSGVHEHPPTPWVPDRNSMFQALKRRSKSDNVALSAIYEDEAARYPDAAPHLLWENVAPSMRRWRRRGRAGLSSAPQ